MAVQSKTARSVVAALKKSTRYQNLLETFNTKALFNLDTDKLYGEAVTQHKLRSVRVLNPQSVTFMNDLLIASTNDQSVRSRMTEILVDASRAHTLLSKSVKYLRQYLAANYVEELRQFRTTSERADVIDLALKPFIDYLASLESLEKAASLVVSDIDKAAFSLRLAVDILRIHKAPERNI